MIINSYIIFRAWRLYHTLYSHYVICNIFQLICHDDLSCNQVFVYNPDDFFRRDAYKWNFWARTITAKALELSRCKERKATSANTNSFLSHRQHGSRRQRSDCRWPWKRRASVLGSMKSLCFPVSLACRASALRVPAGDSLLGLRHLKITWTPLRDLQDNHTVPPQGSFSHSKRRSSTQRLLSSVFNILSQTLLFTFLLSGRF